MSFKNKIMTHTTKKLNPPYLKLYGHITKQIFSYHGIEITSFDDGGLVIDMALFRENKTFPLGKYADFMKDLDSFLSKYIPVELP